MFYCFSEKKKLFPKVGTNFVEKEVILKNLMFVEVCTSKKKLFCRYRYSEQICFPK